MLKYSKPNVAVLVIAVILILVITAFSRVFNSSELNGESKDFNSGWYTVAADGTQVPFRDFGKKLDKDRIEIYHEHDAELNSIDALGFYTYYSAVQVYVGDECIFSYGYIDGVRDRALLGNYFAMVDIHRHDMEESAIKVVFQSDGPQTVYGFKGGSGSAMEMNMIRGYIPAMITPVMTVLFLIVTLILRLKTTTKDLITEKHKWLLTFAFTISFWEIADTQLLMDLGMNAGRACLLSFETFMLLPVPLMMIVYNSCRVMRKHDAWILTAVFVNFAVVNILSITGVMGLLDSLFLTHMVTGAAMITVLVQLLIEYSLRRDHEITMLLWGYSAFLTCAVIQYLNFFVNPSGNNSTVLQAGVLIFILLQISTTLKTVNDRIHKITETLESQTRFITETFRSFVPDEIIPLAIESKGKIATSGTNKYLTVLECDIRGFSELVPGMSPENAIEMLNHYLETMTKVISRHKGTVLDFVGDAIVALFDEEHAGSNHAEKAIFAAVEMQMCMEDIKIWNVKKGYPVFEMGIGINTGYAYVGYIGSDERLEYNAIGSTLNLVSRIESYSTGGQILISQECMDNTNIGLIVSDSFDIMPKGYAEKVRVYNVTGIGEPYNLDCAPKYEVPLAVANPIEVTFNTIIHKHCSEMYYSGIITELSDTSATLTTDFPLKIFDDIRVNLDQSVSCKVISKSGKGYLIRCTSMPNGFSGWRTFEEKEGNQQQ